MLDEAHNLPTTVDIILIPDFSLMAFSSAIEPLRLANRLADRKLYDWRVVSVDGSSVVSSNGVEIVPSGGLNIIQKPKLIFVISGYGVQFYNNDKLFSFLRKSAREGVVLGAFSTGSYVLAKASLLSGRRCTIHWENLESFKEVFPDIEVSSDIYEIDRDRITCSGGTAGLDMMLYLIRKEHGETLAAEISDQFIHDRIREPHSKQKMALRMRLGVAHPKLVGVVEEMGLNLEHPLSQKELAVKAGISTRQLERLFSKYMGLTPTRYYLNLRLNRAKQLLDQTNMSILSVALACGFISASHFSKCFKEYYGRTAREDRNERDKTYRQTEILRIVN